jgi:hypothetical protein
LLCSFLQAIMWMMEVAQKYPIISLNRLCHNSQQHCVLNLPLAMLILADWEILNFCSHFVRTESLYPGANQLFANLRYNVWFIYMCFLNI